jgi:hypothetical protein
MRRETASDTRESMSCLCVPLDSRSKSRRNAVVYSILRIHICHQVGKIVVRL